MSTESDQLHFLSAVAVAGVELKRVGDQHQGPCLFCGGRDRFRVLELGGNVVAKCRKCDFAWADLLKRLWPNEAAPNGPGPKLYLGDDNQSWTCVDPETGATAVHTRRPYVQDGRVGKDYTWNSGTKSRRFTYVARQSDVGPVVICEGEKAADALAKVIPWTVLATVCGASSTPELSSLAPYTAGRHVLLWGDHDEIGRKHMVRIHDLLMLNSAALAVKGVDPMQLGATEKGWDAADWNPPAEPTEALLAARCPVIQASAQTEDDAMLEPGALGAAHGIEAASVVTGRFVPFSEIQPRDVDWLWKQRIAAGEITLAHGSPGDGKSLLGVLLAASITRGLPLPGDEAVRAPGDVALIAHCGEDDPATITRPRLEAAGADLRRVHGWSADGETTLLDAAVAASLMKPVLVVVDSWAAWGDGTSENDSSAVRARFAALQPLRDAGCAAQRSPHFLI